MAIGGALGTRWRSSLKADLEMSPGPPAEHHVRRHSACAYRRPRVDGKRPRNAAQPGRAIGNSTARGFTLLEILVAFTVMAVLLTALLQVFSSGLRAARLGEQYTHAVVLAQSKMASLEVEEDGLALGERAGSFDANYAWRSEVTPYPTDAYPQLEELGVPVYPVTATVEVSWQAGGRPRSVSLKTLRLVPLPWR